MGILMEHNSSDTVRLFEQARAGDPQALNALLGQHRDRLLRMVEVRLDWRLRGRLDASDVVQDVYFQVAGRLDEAPRDPKIPLFLWMRLVASEPLINLQRQHLGTQMPRPRREVPLG